MKWISINKSLPDIGVVVAVKGIPYSNEGEKIGIATLIEGQYFVEASITFGWLDSIYYNDGEFTNDKLEGVTHWAEIPWMENDNNIKDWGKLDE